MDDYFVEDFSSGIVSINEQRDILTRLVKYYTERPENEGPMLWLADERHIPIKTIREHDVFFINEDEYLLDVPEEFQDTTLGLCKWGKIVFAGRIIYPVKAPNGQVMGFCGWTKDIGDIKYLDSSNYGYKAKYNLMFGMERLLEDYKSNKTIVVVEGIVDCLLLRSIGIAAYALLGSVLTNYVVTILKRFGYRLVVIPDNDNFSGDEIGKKSGEELAKQVFYKLPDARVYQTIYNKDLDDVCRMSEEHKSNLVEDLLNLDNMFYEFKELIQRVRPKWKKVQYGKI